MLFAGLALLGLMTVAVADEKKPAKDDKDDEKKLSVGDDAPALKASKWMQGDEVKKFDKDKVYVVEFWATWCGPCIVMMPHVGELQEQYKKDVTIIGFSSKDPSNTEDKVAEFVKKRGPKLKYTFAYEDSRDTYDAWMTASGQRGIPCSFVVDKAGKIAYIGHPMYLDVVLPKVIGGKWKGKDSLDEIKEIEKEVTAMFKVVNGKDADEALEKLAAFEKKYPDMAKIPYFVGPKMTQMVKAKKTDDAQKFAEKTLDSAVKYGDTMTMASVSQAMRAAGKDNKELMALSLKAAEAMLKAAGDKDVFALYTMAETQFAKGDREKAKEYGKKAVEAAEDDRTKTFLEKKLKEYEDDTKKEEDKKDKPKKDD